MLSAHHIQWLDALGSVTAEIARETGVLQIRGLPCRDFHHRGLVLRPDGDGLIVTDTFGRSLARCDTADEALLEGARALAGLDLAAPCPDWRPIAPAAARSCRDWSVYVACHTAPPCVERGETVEALLDAVGAGHLVALQAPPGAGCHALLSGVAQRLARGLHIPSGLAGARLLEVEWLKLNAAQTQVGALGPGERLAQVLMEIAANGHLPVIPRGRVAELARVLPSSLPGIVLGASPLEVATLAAHASVVSLRLPELAGRQLRVVVEAAARALEAELQVTILPATLQRLLDRDGDGTSGAASPTIHQVAPGAALALLRVACQRQLSMHDAADRSRPVVSPTTLELSLLEPGPGEALILHSLMSGWPERLPHDGPPDMPGAAPEAPA